MDSPDSPFEPTDPNTDKALIATPPPSPRPSAWHNIFVGPRGIRAGWKIVIFILLSALVGVCTIPFAKMIPKSPVKGTMTPTGSLYGEFLGMLTVLIPTGIMAKLIDHKKWGYFGMPLNRAFRSTFWIGSAVGLGVLALQLEIMHLCGWFDFGTVQLQGAAIVKYGLIWLVMFTFTGFTEEGLLRGYVQRVTTDGFSGMPKGWDFWTAALIFSIVFGALHLSNPGETAFGIFMVFVDGMVMCFSLWRTGDLWFAIGNHALWDWGQTFLFGTPNSGTHGMGALMKPVFHGPTLLAGGSDGPEGSILVLLSEALIAISVAVLYRRRQYPLIEDEKPKVAEI
jgi:membrane protease YdiL (CAAX protease family)